MARKQENFGKIQNFLRTCLYQAAAHWSDTRVEYHFDLEEYTNLFPGCIRTPSPLATARNTKNGTHLLTVSRLVVLRIIAITRHLIRLIFSSFSALPYLTWEDGGDIFIYSSEIRPYPPAALLYTMETASSSS